MSGMSQSEISAVGSMGFYKKDDLMSLSGFSSVQGGIG